MDDEDDDDDRLTWLADEEELVCCCYFISSSLVALLPRTLFLPLTVSIIAREQEKSAGGVVVYLPPRTNLKE